MSKKLEAYFEETKEKEYEDEKVQSNVLNITLSTSYRKLESLKGTQAYTEYKEKNKWLYDLCNQIECIPVISVDVLKNLINEQYKSCDGFFYNAEKSNEKFSVLIEFKNVNRKKILEFIDSDEDDSIYDKVKDSVTMIRNDIEFEDGYTGEELIERTHFLIVYGDRTDTISAATLGFEKKEEAVRNHRGRQNRAVKLKRKKRNDYSTKREEEILTRFGEKLQKLNLVACPKAYFGVPIADPKGIKQKGTGTIFYYTMLSKHDFAKVVEEVEYFKCWNWGRYNAYFA